MKSALPRVAAGRIEAAESARGLPFVLTAAHALAEFRLEFLLVEYLLSVAVVIGCCCWARVFLVAVPVEVR